MTIGTQSAGVAEQLDSSYVTLPAAMYRGLGMCVNVCTCVCVCMCL